VYDPSRLASFFDEYGEREWERLGPERPAIDRVNFATHLALLQEHIGGGDRVLEAGAGPGRFTIELARIGAQVVVGDISPGQLRLNRENVGAAGLEAAVESRQVLDIVDLAKFEDQSFDATVCFGGPLSYVMDRADAALAELLRVTRRGGKVLLSVMSLWGSMRAFFRTVFEVDIAEHGLEQVNQVVETGDLPPELSRGHAWMRLYRWTELEALLGRHGCTLIAASAANYLSARDDDLLDGLDSESWNSVLGWELVACREPGAIDGGTHMIAVVRRD
jgi:SAM-dependent methyltransferase